MNLAAKTKLFLRYWIGAALVVGAFFLFPDWQAPLSGAVPALSTPGVLQPETAPDQTDPWIQINEIRIPVELAATIAAVEKGLSGRSLLDADKGMLFIFDRADRYRFWMPDMNFPIDIIWIDDGKVVVDTDEDISPKFDPLHPLFYTPSNPVRYVLEVNAGFIKSKRIKIGDPAVFHHIP